MSENVDHFVQASMCHRDIFIQPFLLVFQVVGMTTSGAYGYTVQKSIAFAYVPVELSEPGTEVHVELLGERCLATVQPGAPVLIESMRNKKAKSAS